MPTWKTLIYDVILALDKPDFTIQDIYDHKDKFRPYYPNNRSNNQTIQHYLQRLRDDGLIDFVDNEGSYRLVEQRTSSTVMRDRAAKLEASPEPLPVVVQRVRAIPVESNERDSYEYRRESEVLASSRESILVREFADFLGTLGRPTFRHAISTPSGSALYTDLFDAVDETLYEAKSDCDRFSVRLAIGQLLDYQRFIAARHLAVLLPSAPAPDLLGLLTSLGMGCAFKEGDVFVTPSWDSDPVRAAGVTRVGGR